MPKLEEKGAHTIGWLKGQIIQAANYAHENGIDQKQFRDWKWPAQYRCRWAGRQTSAQPGTRISCHAALDEAARAPFSKERRMKFAKASKFHRKSGEGLGINPEKGPSAVGTALCRPNNLICLQQVESE